MAIFPLPFLGIKSAARELLLPHGDHVPAFHGFAAYRATVDAQKIRQDAEIAWILEKPCINLWYAIAQSPSSSPNYRQHKLTTFRDI